MSALAIRSETVAALLRGITHEERRVALARLVVESAQALARAEGRDEWLAGVEALSSARRWVGDEAVECAAEALELPDEHAEERAREVARHAEWEVAHG